MIEWLVAVNFYVSNCYQTVIENRTGTWQEIDQKHLDQAKKRCGEIYPDAPCVKKFIKTEEQVYRVICGPKEYI